MYIPSVESCSQWKPPNDDHNYACTSLPLHITHESNVPQTGLKNSQFQGLLEENKYFKNMINELENLARIISLKKVFKSDVNVLRFPGISTKALCDFVYALLNDRKEQLKFWRGRLIASKFLCSGIFFKRPVPKRKLTGKEEFTLTTVRLHTGLLISVLADLFEISCTCYELPWNWGSGIVLFYAVINKYGGLMMVSLYYKYILYSFL